jgi:hypothetical protein
MIYAIVSIKNGTLSIHENAFFKGAGTVFQACKKGGFFEKNQAPPKRLKRVEAG